MEGTSQFAGSGERAMDENKKAFAEVEEKINTLSERAAEGEDVHEEMKRLLEQKQRLSKDQGLILDAGV